MHLVAVTNSPSSHLIDVFDQLSKGRENIHGIHHRVASTQTSPRPRSEYRNDTTKNGRECSGECKTNAPSSPEESAVDDRPRPVRLPILGCSSASAHECIPLPNPSRLVPTVQCRGDWLSEKSIPVPRSPTFWVPVSSAFPNRHRKPLGIQGR